MLPEGAVKFYPADKKADALEASVAVFELPMDNGPDRTGGLVAVAPSSSMKCTCPWWFVTPTKEASEANVEVVFFQVSNVVGVDPVGRVGMPASVVGGLVSEEVLNTNVRVPVLVNLCALSAGTVLKRHVPSRQRQTREPKAITVGQVAKRAKLSGAKRSD